MNAQELFKSDGKSAGVWYCSQCQCVVGHSQEQAEACCQPAQCSECSADCKRPWTVCEPCRSERRAKETKEREDRAWEKAAPITLKEAQAFLYPEGHERLVDHDEALTMATDGECSRFYDTLREPLTLDAESILENAVEDWYDGAFEELQHDGLVKSLQASLDAWLGDAKRGCWREDNRRRIDLSAERAQGEENS